MPLKIFTTATFKEGTNTITPGELGIRRDGNFYVDILHTVENDPANAGEIIRHKPDVNGDPDIVFLEQYEDDTFTGTPLQTIPTILTYVGPTNTTLSNYTRWKVTTTDQASSATPKPPLMGPGEYWRIRIVPEMAAILVPEPIISGGGGGGGTGGTT